MDDIDAERYYEDYREYLTGEVARLATYTRLFRRLHERKADRLDAMNLAPAFFSTTIDALFSAIVLWVDKLFGSRSERGLLNLLSFIEQHRDIFDIKRLQERKNYPDDHWMLQNRDPVTVVRIENDRKKIAEFSPLRSFKLRRDKFEAHFDKEYFFDRAKLNEDAPLTWRDLEDVIQLGKEILNSYSADYDGKLHAVVPINAADVDHLLDYVYRQRQKELKTRTP